MCFDIHKVECAAALKPQGLLSARQCPRATCAMEMHSGNVNDADGTDGGHPKTRVGQRTCLRGRAPAARHAQDTLTPHR
eukprot:CAMPEP_0202048292 /NCGR_PEP_ID=MMETSP0963-20130614/2603_1 /ASSEMBLY_ACC=CAM_ASM_000494 /TAXON_ID=4773 /ORGANISM="Schizochytrium aggregatum, Strain ATCC28209" /LENGTH=78 /DNA_ID=CAMNT_0048613161 /DNA_START=50 /DNA_END=284 /DNA_ORIENTATION=+